MLGGGGCSDGGKFKKPSEPWEAADGCLYLVCGDLGLALPPFKLRRHNLNVSLTFCEILNFPIY